MGVRGRGVVAAAVVAAALPLLSPGGLYADLWATVLLLATVAGALNLVAGLAGQLSIGHAALMGAGAYTAGILGVRLGAGSLAGVAAALAVSVVVGLVFGIPSLRVRGQYLALVTIGGGFIFVRLVSEAGDVTGGVFGLPEIPPLGFLGYHLGSAGHAWVSLALFTVTLVIAFNLTRSRAGRALSALKDSEVGAEICGVDVFRMKLAVFVLSSAIASLAGVVFAHKEGFVAPATFDLSLSLTVLIACIVGGLGHPVGGALGTTLLVAPFLFLPALDRYQLVLIGPVALAVLFFAPDGIAGALRRMRGRAGLGSLDSAAEGATAGLAQQPRAPAVGQEAPLLVAAGISKRFGGLVAVEDLSIEVTPGRIHALIGPNGSGKTTLVDCMTGVLSPDAGDVYLDGERVTGRRPHAVARGGVARTFQNLVFFPSLSVLESAALGAHRHHPAGFIACLLSSERARGHDAEAAVRAGAALARVGLAGVETSSSASLSYGESKRLELARALASSPRVLILDEPAAGLNETEVLELAELLGTLRAEGMAILLVDHHMNFVLFLADDVSVLDHGRLIARGAPAPIRSDPAVIEAYLGHEVSP